MHGVSNKAWTTDRSNLLTLESSTFLVNPALLPDSGSSDHLNLQTRVAAKLFGVRKLINALTKENMTGYIGFIDEKNCHESLSGNPSRANVSKKHHTMLVVK